MPAISSFSGSVGPAGSISGGSYTAGGFTANMECALEITTNPEGVIETIRAMKDTWGAWQTSRCAEVLK